MSLLYCLGFYLCLEIDLIVKEIGKLYGSDLVSECRISPHRFNNVYDVYVYQ